MAVLQTFEGDSQKNTENTRRALQRSRDTWFGRLARLFTSHKLDEEVWNYMVIVFHVNEEMVGE